MSQIRKSYVQNMCAIKFAKQYYTTKNIYFTTNFNTTL